MPRELDLLWKQPKPTLVEKVKVYRDQRVKEMMAIHRKFYEKLLLDEDKRNLKECVSRMALGLPPPVGLVGMDRQLFDIIPGVDENEIITALNPIARRSLLEYHGQGVMTSLGLVAELVLQGRSYSNSVKGKISEMYITAMLELSKFFSFKFKKVAKIGRPNDAPKTFNIKISSVVHFLSNKLPPKSSFQKDSTTLFVPDSPNYPIFDFFLWDSDRQLLMAFQVTVVNPISNHPKMTNSSMWQSFCFGDSEQVPMELYWVAPKSCVGTNIDSVKNDLIILFEDLTDFPALAKIVLK